MMPSRWPGRQHPVAGRFARGYTLVPLSAAEPSMQNLSLRKPLAVIDLETTGIRPDSDRIVEISVLLIRPDGTRETKTRRVNPGVPIPPDATRIHGITDADVAAEPRFPQLAGSFRDFLGDADLAGYNLRDFDLPLLVKEFERAQKPLALEGRAIIDAMVIFKRKEQRTLGAAYRFYCGKSREDLHSADADVQACAEILDAQLARYSDLPREPAALGVLCARDPDAIDREAKFVWRDGEAVLNFTRNKGATLRSLVSEDRGLLEWIAGKAAVGDEAKAIARDALAGKLPIPPARS